MPIQVLLMRQTSWKLIFRAFEVSWCMMMRTLHPMGCIDHLEMTPWLRHCFTAAELISVRANALARRIPYTDLIHAR